VSVAAICPGGHLSAVRHGQAGRHGQAIGHDNTPRNRSFRKQLYFLFDTIDLRNISGIEIEPDRLAVRDEM